MRYLLDTKIVSDARRDDDSPASRWVREQYVRDLAISSITLLEIDIGVRLRERRDARAGALLRAWFERQVRAIFAGRILPVDESVVLHAAALHVPDRMPDMDGLIAATAIEHSLVLVTRNSADFARTPVTLLNPWDG